MSHTNSTANYSLPQFVTTDKPAWLTDVNNAYLAIDAQMKNNADAASTADTKATDAGTTATNADTKATTAKNTADGAIASISDQFSSSSTYAVNDIVIYNNLLYKCTTAVNIPGPWTGSTNWARITIKNELSGLNTEIGNVENSIPSFSYNYKTDSKSVASQSETIINSITLTPGTYIISNVITFITVANSGTFNSICGTGTPNAIGYRTAAMECRPNNAGYTTNTITSVIKTDITTYYHIAATQNSGSTITIRGDMHIIKIS